MSAVNLSSYVGLIALGLLTLNILLGLLISVRFHPKRHWPYKHVNIFKVHNWNGYLALSMVLLHPILLLFSKTAGFRLLDIVFPLWSPSQPFENTIGAAALYCLVVVVITSYYRVEIGRRLWKRLHYFAYAAAGLFFMHGLLTDPHLKNSPFNPLDAEKLMVEFCLILVVLGILWRLLYARRHPKAAQTQVSTAARMQRKGIQ